MMKRREFILLLGGAAAAWPLAARGQQADRKRRIGILMTIAANDPEAQARIVVFAQALQALGWTDGRNARIDVRWSTTRSDTLKYAAELAALPSDVILAEGSEAVGPLQAATRTIPIVFVLVPDPVGQGFVDSLARPGANVTGFTLYEFGMAGKWLQLLKERTAPGNRGRGGGDRRPSRRRAGGDRADRCPSLRVQYPGRPAGLGRRPSGLSAQDSDRPP